MHSSHSLSSLLLVTLPLTLLLFVPPTCSTSRGVINNQLLSSPIGFRVALKHVDSGKNLTKFELLQRAMKRGKHRLQRLNSLAASNVAVQTPVHAGNGEFLLDLSIGSPPESYSAILDTGSDLIWTQCKPCKDCFSQSTPIFDPKKSSTFSKLSCSSKLCSALPVSKCGSDACEYLYTYGDESSTEGVMGTETFTFDKVSVPNIGFGCGVDNEGGGFNQGAGLVGLGRGPLSLVSQLDEPKFSYCLTSLEDQSASTLFMGSLASVKNKSSSIQTTPLIKNPSFPSFYYLTLKGITVGDTKLGLDDTVFAIDSEGNGGMIIDSGTTITYLESSAFSLVKKAFIAQTKLDVDDSGSTGLDVCFVLPSGTDSVEVPKLVFHFDGASLDMPAENYIIADSSSGVLCLAMGSSDGMSIFGNVQQQNMLVIHDLERETLSFLPTQCDQL